MGLAGVLLAVALFILIPGRNPEVPGTARAHVRRGTAAVLKNPQTILCGMIAGLLFIPTTSST